jgi:hypothetical protein
MPTTPDMAAATAHMRSAAAATASAAASILSCVGRARQRSRQNNDSADFEF